ncbi:MAG: DUF4405 domain-containing protein [Spirochaetales bacterium]|nr:DUF4405 domain-containing protein [Spirochaetales bacterium]
MKRNTLNFYVDIITFIVFIGVVSTGIILRAPSLDTLPWGITHKELVDFHWILGVLMLILVLIHLLLHWNWAKVNFYKKLKLKPVPLIIIVSIIIIASIFIIPLYFVRGF